MSVPDETAPPLEPRGRLRVLWIVLAALAALALTPYLIHLVQLAQLKHAAATLKLGDSEAVVRATLGEPIRGFTRVWVGTGLIIEDRTQTFATPVDHAWQRCGWLRSNFIVATAWIRGETALVIVNDGAVQIVTRRMNGVDEGIQSVYVRGQPIRGSHGFVTTSGAVP